MVLGRLPHSDLYRDITRYNSANVVEGVRILRFDSPLLFTNIENFKKRAHKLVGTFEQPESTVHVCRGSDFCNFAAYGAQSVHTPRADFAKLQNGKRAPHPLGSHRAPQHQNVPLMIFYATVLKLIYSSEWKRVDKGIGDRWIRIYMHRLHGR